MSANDIDAYIQDLLLSCDQIVHVALTGSRRIAKNDFSCREVMYAHARQPGGQLSDQIMFDNYLKNLRGM